VGGERKKGEGGDWGANDGAKAAWLRQSAAKVGSGSRTRRMGSSQTTASGIGTSAVLSLEEEGGHGEVRPDPPPCSSSSFWILLAAMGQPSADQKRVE